jgi:predicted 2-oxoglutarate/Fe(II)-dependent dioxygenase YbiX
LIAEMSEAPSARGRLVKDGVDGILDEETRRVGSASVSKATRIRVKQRFLEIVPEVETHFGFPLAGCETPGFLVYDAGAFFAAHRDTGPDDPPDIRSRLVSAVVFLNQPSKEPPGDGYGGGTLRFHGLLDGPEWAACPIPFEPEMGLLVAFRSDVLHDVQAVTFGRRFTVVTWFLAK